MFIQVHVILYILHNIKNFKLCRGDKTETRGTAFVIYEDIYDAKNAVDHLSGYYNVNDDSNDSIHICWWINTDSDIDDMNDSNAYDHCLV